MSHDEEHPTTTKQVRAMRVGHSWAICLPRGWYARYANQATRIVDLEVYPDGVIRIIPPLRPNPTPRSQEDQR